MTETDLIKLLSERFYENFADEAARRVLDADAVALLYAVVTSPPEGLPAPVRHKVLFRGAYVLERIYFGSRERFMPYVEAFCRRDFPACTDASARRHFGKIMADLLTRFDPGSDALDAIAETAAGWAVDPASKVAVRVWAVEILKHCRSRISWVAESWEDIVEALTHDATPGIRSRMRKSWRANSGLIQ